MVINKLFDFINKRSQFIIQTPWVGAIGNCAEEIYFGLLKARREGKKVIFLFPYNLFWKFKFSRGAFINRDLLKIQSEYRYDPLWTSIGNLLITIIYACIRIPVVFLRKLLRKSIPDAYIVPNIGTSFLYKPAHINYFSWEIVQSLKWKEQINDYLPIKLPVREYNKARKIRMEMGVPDDEWFVCLHVRGEGFYKDSHGSPRYRNASISNYIEGIKLITDNGGWVVRIGDPTMEPLPPMKQVIDYPHSKFKSNLMDIYLLSECSFFIASASGIWNVAALLFQKPTLSINFISWLTSHAVRKDDICIYKHLYSKSRKRFLSLKERLEEPFESHVYLYLGDDYIYHENTPEEIRDVIKEFLEKPKDYQYTPLQLEFNRERLIHGQRILMDQVIIADNHSEDIINKYSIAKMVGFDGAIGRKFLEQNWEQSIMNK